MKKILAIIVSLTVVFSVILPAYARSGHWKENKIGWWYQYDDGTWVQGSFLKIGYHTFYFNKKGYAVKGWHFIDNNWYYFDDNCYMLKGKQSIKSLSFLFDNEGKLVNQSTSYQGAVGTTVKAYKAFNDPLLAVLDNAHFSTDKYHVCQTDKEGLLMPTGKGYATVTVKGTLNGYSFSKKYGVSITSSSAKIGADFSAYQGNIDFNKVKKSGIQYVILRGGHGFGTTGNLIDGVDRKIYDNLKLVSDAKMNFGLYWDLDSSTADKLSIQDSIDQANKLVNILDHNKSYLSKMVYPIYLDLETNQLVKGIPASKRASYLESIVKAFIDVLHAHNYKNIGIYANTNWFKNYINSTYFTQFPIWQAHYSLETSQPSFMIGNKLIKAHMYQTGSSYYIEGVNGRVDLNYEYSTPLTIKQAGWHYTGKYWYYLNTHNQRVTGWVQYKNKWYFMDKEGIMQTGWVKPKKSWYYLNDSGAMLRGWQKIKNKWYYLGDSGAMLTGWQKINKKWYFLEDSGKMSSNRWIGNYYVTDSGAMAVSTWIGKYHVDSNGKWNKTR